MLSMYTNGKKSLIIATLTELSHVIKAEQKEIGILFSENDQKGVRSRMHKLKPNFRLIGLNELVLLVESIERGESIEEIKDDLVLLLDKMHLADLKVIALRNELNAE
jgi:hypothetical protein